MAASRSFPPADAPPRNRLVTTIAVHGIGLPVRLRLLALFIALVIMVVSAPFDPTTDDADDGSTHRSFDFGRHGSLVPVIGDGE